jgi:hypothetical protein
MQAEIERLKAQLIGAEGLEGKPILSVDEVEGTAQRDTIADATARLSLHPDSY